MIFSFYQVRSHNGIFKCYHCHKILNVGCGCAWKNQSRATKKRWAKRKINNRFKWFCPACRNMPQYNQIVRRILLKALKSS